MSYESLSDQLAKLPFRANVAFAARCAKRVQPLADTLPEQSRYAVERAIAIAETFARAAWDAGDAGAVAGAAWAAAGDAGAAARAVAGSSVGAAWAAVRAAGDAARYAGDAAKAAGYAVRDAGAVRAAGAAEAAAEAAARAAGDAAKAAVENAAMADVARLIALNLGEPGMIGDPIDPSEIGPLGPLWPDGAPDWYTNLPKPTAEEQLTNEEHLTEPAAPPITFYFDTSVFTDEEIADILARFSDLYRAISGDTLVIDRTETLDPSLVLTPEEV